MMMFNSNDKTINFCQCYDDDVDDGGQSQSQSQTATTMEKNH